MGLKESLISVIVPVYNVEPYVRRCLDSIINQTYRELEIIVVDDGSTDRSGIICDEYKRDGRVSVFHTGNRGLSAAKNYGIDRSQGEFIAFIDGDDWVEPWFIEQLIDHNGDGDIICVSKIEGLFTGKEALKLLINENIRTTSWGKLFRRDCFSSLRFPVGRVFEDIATTSRLLYYVNNVYCINTNGYHYCIREGSISSNHNNTNLIDYWIAHREQYEFCEGVLDNYSEKEKVQLHHSLLMFVALAIMRAWGWRYANHISYSPEWSNMSQFVKTMFPKSARQNFPFRIRCGMLIAKYNHPVSFWVAHKMLFLKGLFRKQ